MSKPDFQTRTAEWYQACFGEVGRIDVTERMHRFLEEALELAQAHGCTREDAATLLNYVFSRPADKPENEVGGVLVTLAVLCEMSGIRMDEAGESELARNWRRIEIIRKKRQYKPKGSPLPQ